MVIHSGIILVIMFIIRLMIKIVSGLHPTQNNINIASAGEINYKPRRPNDQVLNPNRVGLYLNSQRGQGGFNSCPKSPQPGTRSRFESNSIDFSQSSSQVLAFLRNLNENPREGIDIVSACSDTRRE